MIDYVCTLKTLEKEPKMEPITKEQMETETFVLRQQVWQMMPVFRERTRTIDNEYRNKNNSFWERLSGAAINNWVGKVKQELQPIFDEFNNQPVVRRLAELQNLCPHTTVLSSIGTLGDTYTCTVCGHSNNRMLQSSLVAENFSIV